GRADLTMVGGRVGAAIHHLGGGSRARYGRGSAVGRRARGARDVVPADVTDLVAAVRIAVTQFQARIDDQRRDDRPVFGELVAELVVLHRRTRQRGFQAEALVGAAGRHEVV